MCCGPVVLFKGLLSNVDYYRAECRTVSWGNVLSWNLMFRNKLSLSAVPTTMGKEPEIAVAQACPRTVTQEKKGLKILIILILRSTNVILSKGKLPK